MKSMKRKALDDVHVISERKRPCLLEPLRKTVIWSGVLKRPILGPSDSSDEEKQLISDELFERVTTKTYPERKLIANAEGLALMHIMDELRSLQIQLDEFSRPLRIAVLDSWAGLDSPVWLLRNDIAHGGHVIQDIRVIEWASSSSLPRAAQWKQAFSKIYGLCYDNYHDHIISAPVNLHDTLNMMASVKVRSVWNQPAKARERKRFLAKCQAIIKAWKENEADFLLSGSKSLGWFRDIQRLYYV